MYTVVYKDKDQNSTTSYSSSEDISDLERFVICGDSTNPLDKRNGWYLVQCVLFLCMLLLSLSFSKLSVCCIQISEIDSDKEEGDEQVHQRGISNVFQEKVCI